MKLYKFFISFIILLSAITNLTQGEEKSMMEKSIPRAEYPRPQMVRSDWMNLNGTWEFEIDNSVSGEAKGFFKDKSFSKKITVPFCPESKLSGINEKDFMASVWYKKTVVIPENWSGKRIFLNFGACDFETTLWVNGEKAGTHIGGYSSFSFEITDKIKKGENTLVIRAIDDTRGSLQPAGKQSQQFHSFGCFYTRTTGIWQTVWLEAVSPVFIKNLKYYPDPENRKINIQIKLDGYKKGLTIKAKTLLEGKDTGAAEAVLSDKAYLSIDLKEKKLWMPDSPNLYDVELILSDNGKEIDNVKSYFGLRTVAIDGKKILINNKPIFQRLVLDQGFYPDGIYTAPTDAALKNDIELSMAMGFNGARLHQKVFEQRFLYWADKLGYLVWGEHGNWGLDHKDGRVCENYLLEWTEIVERDFNSPAIIGWCPFNETSGDQRKNLIRSIYKETKALDQTRPVIDTSGWFHVETEVYDCHDYEQDVQKFAAHYTENKKGEMKGWINFPEYAPPYEGQPYFVSEYGGIWWNPGQNDEKAWGYGNRPKTEQEFIERYKGLTEELLSNPNMFGFCYTQLTDVEQEVNGLYTYERKPKFDPEIIKKINAQPAAFEKE